MSKAYAMALVKLTDKEKFMENYGSKVADVFALYEGHFLARATEATHKEGRAFDLHVIAEFPSWDKANEALGSAEYLAIKPHRIGNIDMDYGSFVVVEGV